MAGPAFPPPQKSPPLAAPDDMPERMERYGGRLPLSVVPVSNSSDTSFRRNPLPRGAALGRALAGSDIVASPRPACPSPKAPLDC